MWAWVEQVWVPRLFNTRVEEGNNSSIPRGTAMTNLTEFWLEDNKLAAAPTIEQWRAGSIPCDDVSFLTSNKPCVDFYNTTAEPFESAAAQDKYTIRSDSTVRVKLRFNSVIPVPTDGTLTVNITHQQDALDLIAQLRNDSFVDPFTSSVVFSATFFNPHANLIALLRVVFRITITGFVQPVAPMWTRGYLEHRGSVLRIQRFYTYKQTLDYIRAALEGMFLLGTIIGTCTELWHAKHAWRNGGSVIGYFSLTTSYGRENCFDFFVLLSTYGTMTLYGLSMREFGYKDIHGKALPVLPEYAHDSFGHAYYAAATFLVVIHTYQLLKHCRFNPRWKFLTVTLAVALTELFHFSILFMIILVGYAFAGNYYYGPTVYIFSSIPRSLQTMLQLAIGQSRTEFDQLSSPEADSTGSLLPVFFYWSFIFIVFFIMVNMFLAIIMKGYDAATEAIKKKATIMHRSLRTCMRVPYQFYMLKLLQKMGAIDKVHFKLSLSRGKTCVFEYHHGYLDIWLKLTKTARKTLAHCGALYVVIPQKWDLQETYSFVEWFIKGTHRETHVAPCTIVSGVMLRVDNINFSELLNNPHHTVTVGLRLRMILGPNSQEVVTGPAYAHSTKAKNVAVGVGSKDFANFPFVIHRPTLPAEELKYGPTDTDFKWPRYVKSWDNIIFYCEKMFGKNVTIDDIGGMGGDSYDQGGYYAGQTWFEQAPPIAEQYRLPFSRNWGRRRPQPPPRVHAGYMYGVN
eukprot:TRINITY_DN66527_c4_g3_i1.p1 TRINITY_DN66527_c4_g3~~TRINITY_DN66527_c4_g3_i1.p1  ORF type:complete len:757 (+),score=40.39 TRINITY_DN66527_c4_g3_i1:55-2271(+)